MCTKRKKPRPTPRARLATFQGRLSKVVNEKALLKQPFIKDPSKTVEQLIKEATAEIGEKISVRRFVKYNLGEGIEKKEEDFAAEVEATRTAS